MKSTEEQIAAAEAIEDMLAPPEIEIDEQSLEMLAKLDARGTSETQVMTIFRASAQELEICRRYEAYQAAYAEAVLVQERRAMSLDDNLDAIEEKALGDLLETMQIGGVVDPRQQLSIAVQANKMARRAPSRAADGLNKQRAHTEAAALNGQQSVVVKLRTKFVRKLNHENGHEEIMARETEVIAKAPKKIADEMTVGDVRRHISEDLNIDLEQLKIGTQGGPGMTDILEAKVLDPEAPIETTTEELDEFEIFLNNS